MTALSTRVGLGEVIFTRSYYNLRYYTALVQVILSLPLMLVPLLRFSLSTFLLSNTWRPHHWPNEDKLVSQGNQCISHHRYMMERMCAWDDLSSRLREHLCWVTSPWSLTIHWIFFPSTALVFTLTSKRSEFITFSVNARCAPSIAFASPKGTIISSYFPGSSLHGSSQVNSQW